MQTQQLSHSFATPFREKPKGITLSLSKNSIPRSNYKKLQISQQQRFNIETSTKAISPFLCICFCQCYDSNHLLTSNHHSQVKQSSGQWNEKPRSLPIPKGNIKHLFIQTDLIQQVDCSNQSTPINRILYTESDEQSEGSSSSKLKTDQIKLKKQYISMQTAKSFSKRCIDISLLSTKNSDGNRLRSIGNSDAKFQHQYFGVVSTQGSVNFSRNQKMF